MSSALWPHDCSLLGSSLHRTLQARILEWVVMASSRGSSWPRDGTHTCFVSCIGRRVFCYWATREALRRVAYYEMFVAPSMSKDKGKIPQTGAENDQDLLSRISHNVVTLPSWLHNLVTIWLFPIRSFVVFQQTLFPFKYSFECFVLGSTVFVKVTH